MRRLCKTRYFSSLVDARQIVTFYTEHKKFCCQLEHLFTPLYNPQYTKSLAQESRSTVLSVSAERLIWVQFALRKFRSNIKSSSKIRPKKKKKKKSRSKLYLKSYSFTFICCLETSVYIIAQLPPLSIIFY